ncbi:MAG TPA: serine hydrolase domain-containing protein [Rhizomicrobium sp.]|jgi:CubicO group peptidase (beta-lactamase class C family)|nr:serine hydrolase domain-containing protein [Rhizomicrobium sp.]
MRLLSAGIGLSFAFLLATGAVAQPQATGPAPAIAQPAATAAPPNSGTHPLTAADLDAYFDGFIPLAIGRGNIAGAEVVVVKDGQVLFEKGYGFSDMKTRKTVDPETTLFRPGSISKLFTWTSVMQLVEQHKLDLDADVNRYLDFKVPHTWGKPVTLRDLMTHTPGFEETIKNLLATDPKAMEALGPGLKAWVPEEMFVPGTTPAYSNYGASLAGYIVQRVSGEPFEQYVAKHILEPLGMTHSTFVQPLPAALARDMSQGYDTASGEPKPFELVWMRPAGALSTTAGDIAKFMIAYLNGGEYNGARILKPQTIALMHSEIYQRDPRVPGMGLGFYHEDTNGHVIVGHGGDTIVFHSDLHLIPDAHVGFYYSQNSAGKDNSGVRGPLFQGFMDRYFPAPAAAPEPTLTSAKADGARVAGIYDASRRSDSNFFRIAAQQTKVSLNDDGTISLNDSNGLNGEPRKWREIKPFVWRDVNSKLMLIATLHNGEVSEIASDGYPQIVTLTRSSFWNSSAWNQPLMIATLAMLLLTVLFWPIKAILRWRYSSPFPLKGRAATVYRLTRVVAVIDLMFLGGYFGALAYGSAHLDFFSASSDWLFTLLQILGVAGVVGMLIPLYEVWIAFASVRPWWTKATDVLIAQACLSIAWFAFTLNLVNFNFNY